MVRQFICSISGIGLWCLLIAFADPAAAELTTSVDRTVVSESDILNLTIRSTESPVSDQVDLTQLKRDFIVINSQQSNRISIVNGRREAHYDLILALAPSRSGTLTIPKFRIGNSSTQPISIDVKVGAISPGQELADVFLDNEVSAQEVYVQEQLLYTLRLYHSTGLQEAGISPPEVNNAIVQQIGEQSKYETILRGVRYSVIELRYAIFPQSSGRITIDEQIFTGRTTSSFGSSIFRNDGRYVRAKSPVHIINILPKPSNYPVNHPWLPSAELLIQDSWQENNQSLRVGEPLTRTITFTAQGLTAAQMPELDWPTLDSVRVYPDQPQMADSATATGIRGQKSVSAAFVPNREGRVEMPAIEIPWWNTQKNQLEYAQLPAKSFSVLPPDPSLAQNTMATSQPGNAVIPPLKLDTAPETKSFGLTVKIWQILSGILMALWLITLIAWWKAKHKTPSSTGNLGSIAQASSLNQAYRTLQIACKNNDAIQARPAIISWFNYLYDDGSINSLDAVLKIADHDGLPAVIDDLNAAIYSPNSAAINWSGAKLIKVCKEIRARSGKKQPISDNELKPLYPL